MVKYLRNIVFMVGLLLASSCTYIKHASIQADYARLQQTAPSLRNLKHMIERQNFVIIGQTHDSDNLYHGDKATKAAVAFSSRFQANERVGIMHDIGVGTHFGLDLPPGDYEILVFSDRNENGLYESNEVIGKSKLSLSQQLFPDMVVTKYDIALGEASRISWSTDIQVKKRNASQSSLFFPAGTIRELSDPIFSSEMSTLGLYDPAAFLEQAPTMFYALEEVIGYKIPVIFVHGIGGSAREFDLLVSQLDRTRFTPWFFYYPSGGDLNQISQLFYNVFLSGNTIPSDEKVPVVIVAHSMGGIVVREALNLLSADQAGPSIEFISLAAPFGGHPSSQFDDDSDLLILPSWRDLNPDGEFIQQLTREPLPKRARHHLFYAYQNRNKIKFGDNSDGVVPLSSQLVPEVQAQSSRQLGLNATHTSILKDPLATRAVMDTLNMLNTSYPQNHMDYFLRGGFEVDMQGDYTEFEYYYLRYYGHYLQALAQGRIAPLGAWQEKLVPMLRGQAKPESEPATAWLKFVNNNPMHICGYGLECS